MDVEILARVQFALTIMFHYIYPPLSIGLGVIMVAIEAVYLFTKDKHYLNLAKFWTKIFALTFAIGVATGIVMEFEFGTNWATYSRYVGDVFGSALAAEGVFAFFLESGFLAILLFGWNRVGPKLHFFASLMVCLGAHFSAVWIIVANSWMQTPAGFHIVGEGVFARAEIVDFWAMVFNPSSMIRLSHSIVGAWLAGSFLVMSVAAYYLLKKRHERFACDSMKFGLALSVVSVVLQLITGHFSAKVVVEYQPAKLAAFEPLFKTEGHAPMYLFGIPNVKEERVDYGIKIPSLLSFIAHGSSDAEVVGLDQFPKKDWPNVVLVFISYRLMLLSFVMMCLVTIVSGYLFLRNQLWTSIWTLRLIVFSVLFPQIGNQMGWMSAEVGRYPWIVYHLLRISEGLSKSVTANHVLISLIMFTILYIFLFILFIYLLNEKIQHGPEEDGDAPVYRSLENVF